MGIFDIIKKIPSINEIKGSFGEWLAKIYAKTLPNALVLHDVLIDGTDQYKSQMDLLIIGNKGIYVVEMKMYSDAKIYGDVQKTKWYYYKHGKKFEIYSPVKQNQKHIEYLKSFLGEFGEVPCFSVITMVCDDFKISGVYPPNTAICNSLPAMERAIFKIAEGNQVVWDEAKKQKIFTYIQQNQQTGSVAREEHKKNVIAYKNDLEAMKRQNVCPYCKTKLVLRNGKYGSFYGCANYPKCKYTVKVP